MIGIVADFVAYGVAGIVVARMIDQVIPDDWYPMGPAQIGAVCLAFACASLLW